MRGKGKKIVIPDDSDVKDALGADEFKQSLVDTLQESNTARAEMKTVLHELLRQPDTIEEIKTIVEKIDRNSVRVFWKKFGFAVWSALLFALGVIVTVIITNALQT